MERERGSSNFNIFRRRLFAQIVVQNVCGTHNKIEWKAPNDDHNECKITQNSSVFLNKNPLLVFTFGEYMECLH